MTLKRTENRTSSSSRPAGAPIRVRTSLSRGAHVRRQRTEGGPRGRTVGRRAGFDEQRREVRAGNEAARRSWTRPVKPRAPKTRARRSAPWSIFAPRPRNAYKRADRRSCLRSGPPSIGHFRSAAVRCRRKRPRRLAGQVSASGRRVAGRLSWRPDGWALMPWGAIMCAPSRRRRRAAPDASAH